MATLTIVAVLSAFLAIGSTAPAKCEEKTSLNGGVVPELIIDPLWIIGSAFMAKFNTPANDTLAAAEFKKVRKMVNGLLNLNNKTNGNSVELKFSHLPGFFNQPAPPTEENLRQLETYIENELEKEAEITNRDEKIWSKANVYFVMGLDDTASEEFVVDRGSVCSDKHKRIAMMRYVKDAETTARIVVRAIGVFLGIGDDFGCDNEDRTAEDGTTACTNVDGFMDKDAAKAKKWTRCSVEDYVKLYQTDKLSCLKEKQPKPGTGAESNPK